MMADVFGGNCLTNCLTMFKPIKTPASPIIMRYALRMRRIINFPVQNTLELKVFPFAIEFFHWPKFWGGVVASREGVIAPCWSILALCQEILNSLLGS